MISSFLFAPCGARGYYPSDCWPVVPADGEVTEESDRNGDEAEKWQARSNHEDQRPPGMGRGETARGVKVGFLRRLAAGTGQLPKDKSAHTKNKGSTGSC